LNLSGNNRDSGAIALRTPLIVPRKMTRQRLPRIRLLHPRDLFGRALGYNAPSVFAAFGAEVDNPVGVADHVQIVLDDDNRIAEVGEPVQHVKQFLNVVEVEAGGWLVEQLKRLARLSLAQLARQLDALRFATGKRHSRLSKMDIT
jgi:hypothetical protein